MAACTNAVVAICVVSVPFVAVGAFGVPVNVGLAVFALLESCGCTWSPLAKASSEPTAAVPSIFGVVVDAAAPSGMSEDVMNPLSFVISLVLVGTGMFTALPVGVSAWLLTWMVSMTLASAPASMPSSLFFSAVVKSFVLRPLPSTLSTLLASFCFRPCQK